MDKWIISYGIANHVLTENRRQSVSKFFESPCPFLRTKHLASTACHTQMNGEAERSNRTTIDRLWHYLAEHHKDWSMYVDALMYVCSTQMHRTTNFPPFTSVISRQSLDLQCLLVQLHYVVKPQRLDLPKYYQHDFYIVNPQCFKTLTCNLRLCSVVTKAIMTKSFVSRHRHSTMESTFTSIGHQWKPRLQRDCLIIRTES